MNTLDALFSMLINLFLLILFTAGFLGIGRKLLKFLVRGRKITFAEQTVFSLGLGVAAFEVISLAFGFLGLFYKTIFGASLIFIILFTEGEWREWGRVVMEKLKKEIASFRNWPTITKAIFLVILVRIGFNFLASQAPITEGDSLWYHLTLPKIFIREHRFADAYFLSSYHAINTEMLYTWAMLLKDEILAQNLSFLVGGVFLTLAIYFFVRKFFSTKIVGLTTLVFVLTPVVAWESVTPKVELFWAFWVLLSFWAIAKWIETKANHWLYLSAIFLGVNFATKGILGAIPLACLSPIGLGLFLNKGKKPLKVVLISLGIIGLIYSPYLIRNFFLTRNPFFPFLVSIFGAGGLDSRAVASSLAQKFQDSTSLINFFVIWWKATMFPVKYNGDIGPLWFTFLPIGIGLFAFKKKKAIVWMVATFCFIWYILWYFGLIHTVRYLLPILPFLSILVAATIIHLAKLGKFVRFLTIGAVALTVPISFLTYFWTFEPYGPKVKAAFGIYNQRTYLLRLLPYTADFFWINDNLAPNAKVLLYLNDWQRPFYLDRPFVLATQLQREIDFRPGRIKDSTEFLKVLKENGVTHIYGPVFQGQTDSYLKDFLRELQGECFCRGRIKMIHKGVGGDVYEIGR